MKRKTLCVIETFCIIIIPVFIVIQLWIGWKYIYESFRIELVIDDSNQKDIEKYLQNGQYGNLNNIDKIQLINAFHHDRYVLYYKDGNEINFNDDNYKELKEYIIENGKSFSCYYIIIFLCLFIIFVLVISIKIKVTRMINIIDNSENCEIDCKK